MIKIEYWTTKLLLSTQWSTWEIPNRRKKPLASQHDLSLAYSPGVAAPCLEIHKSPDTAYDYTNKGNEIAVISNGTAVLDRRYWGKRIKPVMEGKAVLFKKFADIDGIDLELETTDPNAFVQGNTLAPTLVV